MNLTQYTKHLADAVGNSMMMAASASPRMLAAFRVCHRDCLSDLLVRAVKDEAQKTHMDFILAPTMEAEIAVVATAVDLIFGRVTQAIEDAIAKMPKDWKPDADGKTNEPTDNAPSSSSSTKSSEPT